MSNPQIKYRVRPAGEGWQEWKSNGEIAGTTGQAKPIEQIEITLEDAPALGVVYRLHVSNVGWMDPASNCQTAGVEGQRIEAAQVNLFGDAAGQYDVWYNLHVADHGWMNWAKNSEIAGSEGMGLQAEAIQIYLTKAGANCLATDSGITFLKAEPTGPAEPVEAPAPPAPQPPDPEAQRAAVVASAQAHVGYCSEGNNQSFFANYYGMPGAEWCALFDMYNFHAAGLDYLCPQTAFVPDAVNWFLKHERAYLYRRGSYIPRNGDIIYFDYNGNGTPDHTGIVEGCDGTTVCTLEGNTGSPRQVKRKYYNVNDSGIYGYGVPAYGE